MLFKKKISCLLSPVTGAFTLIWLLCSGLASADSNQNTQDKIQTFLGGEVLISIDESKKIEREDKTEGSTYGETFLIPVIVEEYPNPEVNTKDFKVIFKGYLRHIYHHNKGLSKQKNEEQLIKEILSYNDSTNYDDALDEEVELELMDQKLDGPGDSEEAILVQEVEKGDEFDPQNIVLVLDHNTKRGKNFGYITFQSFKDDFDELMLGPVSKSENKSAKKSLTNMNQSISLLLLDPSGWSYIKAKTLYSF